MPWNPASGAPAWVLDEVRLEGPELRAADAGLRAQLCSRHVRLWLRAMAEDDADWTWEHQERLLSLGDVRAWCETLADGRDHDHVEHAYGRDYLTRCSLDSHGRGETDPARQQVWFYPMSERRLVLRVEVGGAIAALTSALAWARDHLDVVAAGVRSPIARELAACLDLLATARRRAGA